MPWIFFKLLARWPAAGGKTFWVTSLRSNSWSSASYDKKLRIQSMGRAIPFNNLGEGLCLCLHRYPTSMHSCSMGPTGTQNPWTIGLIMCMPIHQWCGTDSWELYKTGYSLLGEPARGTTTYTGAYRHWGNTSISYRLRTSWSRAVATRK